MASDAEGAPAGAPFDAKQAARMRGVKASAEKRKNMAGLRRLMKAGELDYQKVIRGEYEYIEDLIEDWTLEQVLRITPGIGTARMFEILRVFGASPRRTLGSFDAERRAHLAALCREIQEIVV